MPVQRREQWANSLWDADIVGKVTASKVKQLSNQLPQRQASELPGPAEATSTAAPLTRLVIIGSNYGSIRKRSSVRQDTTQLLEVPWHVHAALELINDTLLANLQEQGIGGLQAEPVLLQCCGAKSRST